MNILASASKIAFLLLVFTACVAFLLRILDSKDFMVLTMAAASFYFAYKGTDNSSSTTRLTATTDTHTETPPYAGK